MNAFRLMSLLFTVLLAAFITVPLGAMAFKAESFMEVFLSPVVQEALKLSLITSFISLVVIVILGTPAAYYLSRSSDGIKKPLELLVDLPMVLPPAVAGIALLAAFGREGFPGSLLYQQGITIPFTTAAVVMAQSFVALPLYVRTLKAGFDGVSRNVEFASFVLGASELYTFFRISIPLASTPFFAALVLSWARALGEFGATIMFAGNFMGKTQTLPLAVYSTLQSSMASATAVAMVLVALSMVVLLSFEVMGRNISA